MRKQQSAELSFIIGLRLCNAHYAIMNNSSTLAMGYRDLP